MRKFGVLFSLLFVLALSLSCDRERTVCFTYRPTPVEGWEQHNALTFPIDSVQQTGEYNLSIGVRTTYDYPFQTLWFQVTTRLEHSHLELLDTLVCQVTDPQGNTLGHGISIFQYVYPLTSVHLNVGQRGTITVKHIMRRNMLPGVSDVGVVLRKKE